MKLKETSAKVNYIYSVLYSILSMILPVVTAPYVARVIGAKGLGIYSYNYTIVGYFATFALLGINFYGNRTIAKIRDDFQECSKAFSEIYIMQLITSISMIILYVVYIMIFVKDNLGIALIMAIVILSPSISVNWFFNGLEMFKITVIRNLVIKILTVVCTFVFVKSANDLWKYALILSLGTFFSEGYLILLIRKYVNFSMPKVENILIHFKPNMVLFIPILAVSVYRSMDKLMIKWITDYVQVGFYTNAEKIINICIACITSLGQVMLPKMTNLLSNGKIDHFKSLFNKSLKFVSLISIAMTFGIISVCDVFVPVFFGDGYEACIPILKLLSINIILLAWGNVLKSEYLIPKEKDKLYIISVVIGAIVNFIINLLLISKWGSIGAVIGTICAELVSLIVIIIWIGKDISLKNNLIECLPFVAIGIIMYVGTRIVGIFEFANSIMLIIQVFTGIIIFSLLTILYWHIKQDEFEDIVLDIIKKILRKFKGLLM